MAAESEASQESALGAYSPVDYMSITSFPRLPEDEPAPAAPLRGRKDEDAFLGDPDTGEARLPRPCPSLASPLSSICVEHPPPASISLVHSLDPHLSFLPVSVNYLVWKGVHFCLGGIGCDKGADARDCSRRDWDYLLGRTNQQGRNVEGEILKKSCDHPVKSSFSSHRGQDRRNQVRLQQEG